MALLPGSPAIGTGTRRQRHHHRPARLARWTARRHRRLPGPVQPAGGQHDCWRHGSPLGTLDLRGAVDLADVLPGAQTITFDPTVFASAQTITLTGPARAEQHERDGDDHGPGGGRDGQRRRAEPGVPGR